MIFKSLITLIIRKVFFKGYKLLKTLSLVVLNSVSLILVV